MLDEQKIKAIFGWENSIHVVALLPLGYPDEAPTPRKRRAIEEIILKWNSWAEALKSVVRSADSRKLPILLKSGWVVSDSSAHAADIFASVYGL